MQKYLPKPKPGKGTDRMEIGDQGEEFCVKNLCCESCGDGFSNLNDSQKNIVGVDLQCRGCGEFVQVKTFQEQSGGKCPVRQTYSESSTWDETTIPSLSSTLRVTLKRYHNKIRYYCVIYKPTLRGREVQYIAITEPLSLKNMGIGEKSIMAKHTKWIIANK